jgi:hypothetical protein
MTGFDLLQNFTKNPESFLRRVWARVVPPQRTLSASEPVISAPSASNFLAQKTFRNFSAPTNNVPVGPNVNIGGENFEIKTGLITMV